MVNANLTFEFLYCFDNKFNTQAFSSIISLLDKVDNLISINIIHNDEKISALLPSKIISLDETSIKPAMLKEYSRCKLGKRCVVKLTTVIYLENLLYW